MKKMTMLVAALSILVMSWRAAEAADAKPDAKAAWEKTVAGAKKEGEVRLWGDMEITHPDIVAAFTKEFSFIKAVLVSGRVGDLMPRIAAERRVGKYLADLYSGGLGGRAFFDAVCATPPATDHRACPPGSSRLRAASRRGASASWTG